MVTSDFGVDRTPGRAELRSATTTHGALFVMMHGELLMLWWPADSSDFLQQVFVPISTNYMIFTSPLHCNGSSSAGLALVEEANARSVYSQGYCNSEI